MATTTNFGWETPDDTDLVKDGALAIRTLGNSIDTSLVDLKGGTTGQVLSKTSNTDMDFTWVTSDDANAIQNAIVDAKGDLITATAADTPARLAVGNSGETLVADSSTSTGLRYQTGVNQNSVINGGFDIWQRGTSLSVTQSAQPLADRFYNVISGSTYTSTASRQNTSDSTNLPFIQYCMRIARTSGQTGTGINYLMHSLETAESLRFAGRTVTVSFYARAGANFSGSLTSWLYSGTGTDQSWALVGYTGQATVATSTPTLTTTWQRFSYTGTVASSATELSVIFGWTPSGTAGANDYYEITGIQLELGSVATTFKRAGVTLAGELQAAQRYYWRNSSATGAFPLVSTGYCENATNAYFAVVLPTEMRVAPTSPTYSNLRVYDASALSAVTAVVMTGATAKVANLAVTTTGLTAGRACVLLAGTTGSPYIDFTAEL